MKYFLRVLIVFVLAAAVVFGVFRYTNPEAFSNGNNSQLTTVSKPAATEKNSNRVLLASIEDEDFYLYKGSKGVLLKHGKNEFTFTNWSKFIDAEPPEMRLSDFNDDGKNELLIKAVCDKKDDGSFIYEIYILTQTTDSEGKEQFDVSCASRNTWRSILDKNIIEEMRQLKNCKKIIQFTMNAKGNPISYDKQTGIATNGHAGYARALQDNKGNYMTVSQWNKGDGIYSITKDNRICVNIDINISYEKSSKIQNAGTIYFELFLNDDNLFQVTEKTMVFKPNKEYTVSDPTKTASESWYYTENNSTQSASAAEEVIKWIKYSPDYSSDIFTQTKDYSSEVSDMNKIKSVYLCESFVRLTAREGCSFDSSAANSGDFSVILNDKYDIAYTCEINTAGKNEILLITFDKAYPQEDIKAIVFNYGTK